MDFPIPTTHWPSPWEPVDALWALSGLRQNRVDVAARYMRERLARREKIDGRVIAELAAMLLEQSSSGWKLRPARRGGRASSSERPIPDPKTIAACLSDPAERDWAVEELSVLLVDGTKRQRSLDPWRLEAFRSPHRPVSRPWEKRRTESFLRRNAPWKIAQQREDVIAKRSRATAFRDRKRLRD